MARLLKRSFNLSWLLVALVPTTLLAASDAGISVYPTPIDRPTGSQRSQYTYLAAPGSTMEDRLTIQNSTDRSEPINLYIVNTRITSSGVLTLQSSDEPKVDIANWVSLMQPNVTVAPHSIKDLSFILRVPQQASVGDHIGGIVAELAPQNSSVTSGPAIDIVRRFGVIIEATVPGRRRPQILITHFNVRDHRHHLVIGIALKNSGNVNLTLHGQIKLSAYPVLDGTVTTPAISMPPGKTAALSLTTHTEEILVAHPAAILSLSYANQTETAATSGWWFDWPWLLITMIIAIAATILGLYWYHKGKNS